MAHAVLKSFELLTSDLSVQALDKNFSVRTGTRLAHGRRKGCQRCSTVWLPLRFISGMGSIPPVFHGLNGVSLILWRIPWSRSLSCSGVRQAPASHLPRLFRQHG